MDIVQAHRHSANHDEEIKRSTVCGCFHCCSLFDSKLIDEWVDDGRTALCPHCGIDSVIGDASGYPVTESFLSNMRDHWFS